MLERLDPNPEYWEGKRGACVGVFQMIIAGREDRFIIFFVWQNFKIYTIHIYFRQALADVIQILRNTSNPQVIKQKYQGKRLRYPYTILAGWEYYQSDEEMGKR